MKNVSICLDVGGTFIKGALFSTSFEKKYTDVHYYPANSQSSKMLIIENFENIFQDLLFSLDDEWVVDKIAIAFPGPFDYSNGISLIKKLGKFDELYQVNLKEELKKIQKKVENYQFQHAKIFFKNDAEAFAFGENSLSEAKKGAYFTLGTGLGSTFIKNGKSVKGQYKIPDSGMIFNDSFLKSIVDDYASARGLSKIINKYYLSEIDGQQLFNQANEGISSAINVFQEFGKVVKNVVEPYISEFKPQEIVFGGQISKSLCFFQNELEGLAKYNDKMIIRASEDTTLRTLEGLFILKEEEN